jgi:hypothetical protein
MELTQLAMLFTIEQHLIKGMVHLTSTILSPNPFTPAEFNSNLTEFGQALQNYRGYAEGDNAIFALFDKMVQRAGGSRNSSLTMTASVNGNTTTKMLIA